MEKKTSSVSVAKTDLTPEVQKLGDCKSYRRKRERELQIRLLKAFYIPLGKAKHYLAQSKETVWLYQGAQDPAEFLGQHEKAGFKWCCNIMSAEANGFL